MITLSIETSCDETSIALIEESTEGIHVITHHTHSQIPIHVQYGGVFPHVAKREHAKLLFPILKELKTEKTTYTITQADLETIRSWTTHEPELYEYLSVHEHLSIPSFDRIAVTTGPGLEPTLWVGINFARSLSLISKKPLITVNHMEGHIMSALFDPRSYDSVARIKEVSYPLLAVLVSGGHTEFVYVKEKNTYEVIGHTKDDAVGEAYDKVARLIGIPYPGGSELAKLAIQGREKKLISFPRPMLKDGLDMSFSGLKTSVLYHLRDHPDTPKDILAASFESAIHDVLIYKTRKALEQYHVQSLIVAGGVIANTYLRTAFETLAHEFNIPIYLPPKEITGDNALMIALASLSKESSDIHTVRAHGTLSW